MLNNCDILIVEPHEETRRCLVEIFTQLDQLSVLAVEDGKQALDALESSRPKVILLDYHIPLIDGRSFLEIKAENEDICRIPLIVMSTMPVKMLQESVSVLRKPFHLMDLLETIQKHC